MKRVIGIDIGINNLISIANNFEQKPILINGRFLKSLNQYANKQVENKQVKSKKRNQIEKKLFNRLDHYFNIATKLVIEYCLEQHVACIVIGHSNHWLKNSIDGLIHEIDFISLFNKIVEKAKRYEIEVIIVDESYTSKCDALSLEAITFHKRYKGYREQRGLFKSAKGVYINADINGALNILRKGIGDEFIKNQNINSFLINPQKINLIQPKKNKANI